MTLCAFKPPQIKSCVLICHGTGNDALFAWNIWIERLLEAHCAVLTFDMEGHGAASSSQLDLQQFARSSTSLAAWLESNDWPLSRLTIAAYSLGGLYALAAIAGAQLKPQRLLLMALPLRIELGWPFIWNEAWSWIHPYFWKHMRRYGWRASIPAFGRWRRESFPVRLQNFTETHYAAAIRTLFREKPPLELAARCQLPCLLIHGDRDRLAPPAAAAALAGVLKESETVIVKSANHFLLPWYPEVLERAIPWLSLDDILLPRLTGP